MGLASGRDGALIFGSLRPISSAALCASLTHASQRADCNRICGIEFAKDWLQTREKTSKFRTLGIGPQPGLAVLSAVAKGGRKSGLIKGKLHAVLESNSTRRRRLSSRKTICPSSRFFGTLGINTPVNELSPPSPALHSTCEPFKGNSETPIAFQAQPEFPSLPPRCN